MLAIRICDSKEEWNSLLEKSTHSTVFHLWDWLKIAERYTGSKLYPLIGFEGIEVAFLFPIFIQKKRGLTLAFSPPPNASIPFLGPVTMKFDTLREFKKEDILQEMQESVETFLEKELGVGYSRIFTPPGFSDCRFINWAGYVIEPFYNYVIDLRAGESAIFNSLPKNTRQDITRAERNGVSVEMGTKEDIAHLISSLSKRYTEQSRRFTLPNGYLDALLEAFSSSNLTFLVARKDGRFVGGIIDLHYKGMTTSWFGLPKSLPCVNEFLQWHAIKHALSRGSYTYLETGANTQRLCTFKTKYNPGLSIYFSAKKCHSIFLRVFMGLSPSIHKYLYAIL